MTLVWHVEEKEVLIAFDELGWIALTPDQASDPRLSRKP
jgi:hypothetical protein